MAVDSAATVAACWELRADGAAPIAAVPLTALTGGAAVL